MLRRYLSQEHHYCRREGVLRTLVRLEDELAAVLSFHGGAYHRRLIQGGFAKTPVKRKLL